MTECSSVVAARCGGQLWPVIIYSIQVTSWHANLTLPIALGYLKQQFGRNLTETAKNELLNRLSRLGNVSYKSNPGAYPVIEILLKCVWMWLSVKSII